MEGGARAILAGASSIACLGGVILAAMGVPPRDDALERSRSFRPGPSEEAPSVELMAATLVWSESAHAVRAEGIRARYAGLTLEAHRASARLSPDGGVGSTWILRDVRLTGLGAERAAAEVVYHHGDAHVSLDGARVPLPR